MGFGRSLRVEHGAAATCVALVALGLTSGSLGGCHEDRSPYLLEVDLGGSLHDLASDDLDVSSRAASRLEALGAPVLPVLAVALRREPKGVRLGVVEVLGEMRDEGVTPLLAGAVADPDAEVRADAAFALRSHPGAVAEQALLRGLGDADPTVRRSAATACGAACRSAAAVRALVGCALDDSVSPVGWAAVVALGRLRTTDAPALEATVDAAVSAEAPARLARADVESRARAAVLLAVVSDERAAPVLEAAVTELHDPRERLRAIYGLGFVAGPGAIPVLRGLLAEPGISAYARDALRRAAERGVTGADAALAGYGRPLPPLPPPP
jgi:HEAT repeat protein